MHIWEIKSLHVTVEKTEEKDTTWKVNVKMNLEKE
jgi:hypothetical protein